MAGRRSCVGGQLWLHVGSSRLGMDRCRYLSGPGLRGDCCGLRLVAPLRMGRPGRHRLALAAGATLTYAWHSFPQKPVVSASATIDLIGNTVFSLGTIFVIWMAARRANSTASNTQGSV